MVTVSAFEPFGGRRVNRSLETLRALPESAGRRKVRLPVDFEAVPEGIAAIAAGAPDAVLLLGEAPGRWIRVEGMALNVMDSDRPDQAGLVPSGHPCEVDGPMALPARWSVHEVSEALRSAGLQARASFHAGTFVCNASLYHALRILPPSVPVGFLHLPRRPFPFGPRRARLVRAVEIAAERLLREVIRRPEGGVGSEDPNSEGGTPRAKPWPG